MSEITLSLEHPSLGCGEVIARYDLSEIQEKAYQQGRADAIEEFVNFYQTAECPYSDDCKLDGISSCVKCLANKFKE